MAKVVFLTKIEGVKELTDLFEQLPKSLTDQVVKNTAKKALQPVLDHAKTTVLHQSSVNYDLLNSMVISTRLSKSQRQFVKKGEIAVYAGPAYPKGAVGHLIEFGTGPRYTKAGKYVGIIKAEPFMRPAWDAEGGTVLEIMREDIWGVLKKAVRSLRRRAQRGTLSKSQFNFLAK